MSRYDRRPQHRSIREAAPNNLAGIRARWSRNGGMGNDRGDEDYTDAGCRILARAAFRDFPVLDAEVRALRAENAELRRAFDREHAAYGAACALGTRIEATRDSALAELAAARDQIAAVTALADRLRTKTPRPAARTMAGFDAVLQEHDEWVADQIAAALSQSGQPTKEEPA